jgi:hypothetical protein
MKLTIIVLSFIALVAAGVEVAPAFTNSLPDLAHALTAAASGSQAVTWHGVVATAVAAVMPQDRAPLALSVIEFCRLHGISRAFFYKLRAAGLGPTEMRVGNRTLISVEAAARWRAEREAATAQRKIEAPAASDAHSHS